MRIVNLYFYYFKVFILDASILHMLITLQGNTNANDGTRTHTPVRTTDFKSVVSANSTTLAECPLGCNCFYSGIIPLKVSFNSLMTPFQRQSNHSPLYQILLSQFLLSSGLLGSITTITSNIFIPLISSYSKRIDYRYNSNAYGGGCRI